MRSTKGLLATFAALVITASLSPSAFGADNDADLAVKDDLRNLANELETYFTDHQNYPGKRAVTYDGARRVEIGKEVVRLNRGDRLAALRLTRNRQAYCIHVVRTKGAGDTTDPWSYVSDQGGIVTGGCPKRFSRVVA